MPPPHDCLKSRKSSWFRALFLVEGWISSTNTKFFVFGHEGLNFLGISKLFFCSDIDTDAKSIL